MKSKGQMNEYHRKWAAKHEPGPGVIRIVPKLAEGAINPMWATTESVIEMAELFALPEQPKKKFKPSDNYKQFTRPTPRSKTKEEEPTEDIPLETEEEDDIV